MPTHQSKVWHAIQGPKPEITASPRHRILRSFAMASTRTLAASPYVTLGAPCFAATTQVATAEGVSAWPKNRYASRRLSGRRSDRCRRGLVTIASRHR